MKKYLTELEYNQLSETEKLDYYFGGIYNLKSDPTIKITYLTYYELPKDKQDLYIMDNELEYYYYEPIMEKVYNKKLKIKFIYLNETDFKLPLCSDNLPIYDCDESPHITELKEQIKILVDYKKKFGTNAEINKLTTKIKTIFKIDVMEKSIKNNIDTYKELNNNIDYNELLKKIKLYPLEFILNNISVSYNQDIWTYDQIAEIYRLNNINLECPPDTDTFYIRNNYDSSLINIDPAEPTASIFIDSFTFKDKKQFYNHNTNFRNLTRKIKAKLKQLPAIEKDNNTYEITNNKVYPYATFLNILLNATNINSMTPTRTEKGRDIYYIKGHNVIVPTNTCYDLHTHFLMLELLTHLNYNNTELKIEFSKYLSFLGYDISSKENVKKRKKEFEYRMWLLSIIQIQKTNKDNDFKNKGIFSNTDYKINNDLLIMQLNPDYHKLLYPNYYNDNIPEFIIDTKTGKKKLNKEKIKCITTLLPDYSLIYKKSKLAGQLILKLSLRYNMTSWNNKTKKHYFSNHISYNNEFIGALYSIQDLLIDTSLEKYILKDEQGNYINLPKDLRTYIFKPFEQALELLVDTGNLTEFTYRKEKGELINDKNLFNLNKLLNSYIAYKM